MRRNQSKPSLFFKQQPGKDFCRTELTRDWPQVMNSISEPLSASFLFAIGPAGLEPLPYNCVIAPSSLELRGIQKENCWLLASWRVGWLITCSLGLFQGDPTSALICGESRENKGSKLGKAKGKQRESKGKAKGKQRESKGKAKGKQRESKGKAKGKQRESKGKAKGKQRESKGKAKGKQRESKGKAKGKQRESKGKAKGKQRESKGKAKGKQRESKGKARDRKHRCMVQEMQGMHCLSPLTARKLTESDLQRNKKTQSWVEFSVM